MSLITYEFNRADNAGEISQFRAISLFYKIITKAEMSLFYI